MDDNKEKDLQGEEMPRENAETLSEQEKEAVGEILEKLKNSEESVAVTDWDGLAEVGGDDKSIIETEGKKLPLLSRRMKPRKTKQSLKKMTSVCFAEKEKDLRSLTRNIRIVRLAVKV